ncbi:FxsA family membrane protein [Streptomyces sp. NPDC002055]|uniref:FxsA family membrane protein n=1 Tax=Streptomyces sp. NPDC002055 TaxID=3154534 RepID=UPI003332053C
MTTGTPHQNSSRGREPGRRRSRARRFLPLAVAAWLVLELWLLIVVGEAFGGLTVLLLLVAGAVLGGYVIKRAGRRAWRGLTADLQAAQAGGSGDRQEDDRARDGDRSSGNTLPMLGGLLLMMPGLMSDALGLLCILPPTRTLLHRSLERSLERRMRTAQPGTFGDAFQQARMHRPDGKVVQGEVVRDDMDAPGGRPHDEDGPRPPLTH